MKTKKHYYLLSLSVQHYLSRHVADQELPQLRVHKKPRQKPPLKLRTIPTRSWMIYISRRTRSLQIMRMYGTRYLA